MSKYINSYNFLDKIIATMRSVELKKNFSIENKNILDFGCGSNFKKLKKIYSSCNSITLVDRYFEDFSEENLSYINYKDNLETLNTKTKDVKALMASLKLENEKVLFILSEKNENAYLGSRNLKKVKVVTADSFNTYDLLNASKIIVSSESIKKIENILN